MQKRIDSIDIDGKSVPLLIQGSAPFPCLFIGPGDLYFPTFPPELFEMFTFYSADRYFTYPINQAPVSEEEIQSLTWEKYLEFYEKVREALALEDVTIMGPSALGLLAHAYADRYPKFVSQVIMLGTPSTTTNLLHRQTLFMQANYGPARFDEDSKRVINLTTKRSEKKWVRFQKAQADFSELEKENLSADEVLIQELLADQEKYSVEPEAEQILRDRWNRFNTIMRQHFFGKMIVGFEMAKEITVPTLVLGGMYDGIAPYYDLVDKIKTNEIQGKIYYAILKTGHSPQTSNCFTEVIKTWVDWISKYPDGEVDKEVWLTPISGKLEEQQEQETTSLPSDLNREAYASYSR